MFGERLKALRKTQNLTQEELAVLLKTSRTTLAGYEQGIREPNINFILSVSRLFNVSCDYLLGGTNARESIEDLLNGFFSSSGSIGCLENLRSEIEMAPNDEVVNAIIKVIDYLSRSLSTLRKIYGTLQFGYLGHHKDSRITFSYLLTLLDSLNNSCNVASNALKDIFCITLKTSIDKTLNNEDSKN